MISQRRMKDATLGDLEGTPFEIIAGRERDLEMTFRQVPAGR